MSVWILVIIIHGWGAGIGSAGNAITSIEFNSKDKCLTALQQVTKVSSDNTEHGRSLDIVCIEK